MAQNDSTARGIRIKNETIARITERANRKGWTFNRWMNWAIKEGLRIHRKQETLKDGEIG